MGTTTRYKAGQTVWLRGRRIWLRGKITRPDTGESLWVEHSDEDNGLRSTTTIVFNRDWVKPRDPAMAYWIPFNDGDRVRLRQDVERYPHFIAKAGMTGTVTNADAVHGEVYVRMDDHLDGAEEWDNEIVWSNDDMDWLVEDLEVIS